MRWPANMSGVASVPLAILGIYVQNAPLKMGFLIMAIGTAWYASFAAWEDADARAEKLEAENALPNLSFHYKFDSTQRSFVRASFLDPKRKENAFGTATVIITNNSPRPIAIIEWSASMKDVNGVSQKMAMNYMTLEGYPVLNLTPLPVPAFGSVDAHLIFNVNDALLPDPVIFEVKATDALGQVHTVSVTLPRKIRNTMQ